MTVEELIEELRTMPSKANVFVLIPMVERDDYYELVDQPIESMVYAGGNVSIRVEE